MVGHSKIGPTVAVHVGDRDAGGSTFRGIVYCLSKCAIAVSEQHCNLAWSAEIVFRYCQIDPAIAIEVARSDPGRGSVFTVALPLSEGSPDVRASA